MSQDVGKILQWTVIGGAVGAVGWYFLKPDDGTGFFDGLIDTVSGWFAPENHSSGILNSDYKLTNDAGRTLIDANDDIMTRTEVFGKIDPCKITAGDRAFAASQGKTLPSCGGLNLPTPALESPTTFTSHGYSTLDNVTNYTTGY